MITFSVSSAALRLVAPHVSPEASRPVLNGLYLELGGVMVATNGCTLAALPDSHNAPASLLLAGPWHKVAKDKGRAASDLHAYATGAVGWVTVTLDGEGRFTAVNNTTGNAISGEVLAYTYPNWRQVIPRTVPDTTPSAVALDPRLLALFDDTTGKYDAAVVSLHFGARDRDPIRVSRKAFPRFVGLIMPCNNPQPLPTEEPWHLAPVAVVAPETVSAVAA